MSGARDLTPEEATEVRRVASLLSWPLKRNRLARKLNAIADEYDAPQACECCRAPAVTADVEGVPLCQRCADACPAAPETDS